MQESNGQCLFCSQARAPADELSPVNLAADGLQISNWAALVASAPHAQRILQELVRVLRGARAAFAGPSQDVYVAAEQFQTNCLLGDPGRRPDAAPKSRAEPAIQDTALLLPSLEDISSGRTIHPSRARRRTRRLPSQVRRTLPVVRSPLLVVRTLPPWKAEGRV